MSMQPLEIIKELNSSEGLLFLAIEYQTGNDWVSDPEGSIEEDISRIYIAYLMNEIKKYIALHENPEAINYLQEICVYIDNNYTSFVFDEIIDHSIELLKTIGREELADTSADDYVYISNDYLPQKYKSNNNFFILRTDLLEEVYNAVAIMLHKLTTLIVKQINKLKGQHTIFIPLQTQEHETINLKYISHKVVVLEELGIIDFLLTKYPTLYSNRNSYLASIFTPLIGENSDWDTVRRNLGWLQSEDDPKNPRTKSAMKKVRELFNSVGLVYK